MRSLVLILPLLSCGLLAQHRMYVTDIRSKGWVVGARVNDSGLQARDFGLGWEHRGFLHPDIQSIAFDPRDPRRLFLAGGSGLILAEDRGRRWRILTASDMTEARDVAIDRHEPDSIYLALPDGLGVSHDGGKTWTRAETGLTRHYTHTVAVDRTRAGRILHGGETGVWLSDNRGAAWRQVAAGAAETTDLAQSPTDPSFWLATTQHAGLWASRDGGATWTRIEGVAGDKTLYNSSFDPTTSGRIAICGWGIGVQVSTDNGKTWSARNQLLPTHECWRVAWDPDYSGRLYAGIHEEALYKSDDAGLTWANAGLDGSIIFDMAFVKDPMPATFAERRQEVLTRHAAVPTGIVSALANLYLKRAGVESSEQILEYVINPTGDMFWMFPTVAATYLDQGQLTAEARAAIRRAWKTYMPYRGDTENHWVMYYSSLYLMAQRWKGLPASEWYTGKSSEENLREAETWLNNWVKLTLDRGQGEYDCTHYIDEYSIPLAYLSAWAEDPQMRKRAAMILEYIQADFAQDTLEGLYVGAHARTDDVVVREKWHATYSDLSWLLFGKGYPLPYFSGYTTFFLVSGVGEPPAVVRAMAERRTQCTVQYEKKRTRNRWRFNDQRNGNVFKTTYMCPDYAVGSDQGGALQPIQQHSWDVTWRLDDPRGKQNTLFAMHPYSSLHELQTYFTFMPDFATEEVVRSKKTYDSADKFLGGSAYEQIAQDRDAIVSLYNIPAGTRFEHINGFFSRDLDTSEEDASGWIFSRGGQAYIAFRPLAAYQWEPLDDGGRRLVSPHLKNGVIMQVASASEFASWDEFKSKIRALPLEFKLEPTPHVKFTTLRGRVMECEYGHAPRVDGVAIPYEKWKPFDSQFIQQERGSHKVTFSANGLRRTLDFDTLTAR